MKDRFKYKFGSEGRSGRTAVVAELTVDNESDVDLTNKSYNWTSLQSVEVQEFGGFRRVDRPDWFAVLDGIMERKIERLLGGDVTHIARRVVRCGQVKSD